MSDSVDWDATEKLLLETATQQLTSFAADHASETIYGAIFDVEPYDGCGVSLLLSTEANLLKEWGEPIDATNLHRRFLPGAFAHTLPLTESKAFPAGAIEELVEADIDDDSMTEDG